MSSPHEAGRFMRSGMQRLLAAQQVPRAPGVVPTQWRPLHSPSQSWGQAIPSPGRAPGQRGPSLDVRRRSVVTRVALVGSAEALHSASHLMGSQALLWYGFMCTLCASVGASSMQLIKVAWETLGLKDSLENGSKARIVLYGVDIPASSRLNSPEVLRAVEFAAMAHAGQVRKTGEPYVAHCIETALIVEELLAPTEDEDRKTLAMVSALLHDVVDDTHIRIDHIQQSFGKNVARKVDNVSQISRMNQLMRRLERKQGKVMKRETLDEMRNLILQMVDDPLVLLVKLADRLHNMRTVYALRATKRGPVAKETMHVWCPLAERLGLFPLKAELEDLCFAVLQPEQYATIRRDLDRLWHLRYDGQLPPEQPTRAASPSPSMSDLVTPRDDFDAAEADEAAGLLFEMDDPALVGGPYPDQTIDGPLAMASSSSDEDDQEQVPQAPELCEEQLMARELLGTVLPFTATRFSTGYDGWLAGASSVGAGEDRGLRPLLAAARELHRELAMGGHVLGLPVKVQGRLKSLYSIHRKMCRKNLSSVADVLDARALRVIVDDEDRRQMHSAIMGCYRLNDVVQRLWRPIHAEADDYIANPKQSGYQSLHSAVLDSQQRLPFEVQVRTETMHRDAEYGAAAHWAYKETGPPQSSAGAAATTADAVPMSSSAPATSGEARRQVGVGQPVWRINPDAGISDGVVVDADPTGRQLLVASTSSRRFFTDSMVAAPGEYRAILRHVRSKGYFAPGQGDLQVALELYCLCQDGKYHKVDHCGHKHGTTVVPLFRFTEALGVEKQQAAVAVAAAASPSTSPPQGVAVASAVCAADVVSAALHGGGEWPPGSLSSTGSFDMPYDEVLALSPASAPASVPAAAAASSPAASGVATAVANSPAAAVAPAPEPLPGPSDELAAELAAHSARVNQLRQALEARGGAAGAYGDRGDAGLGGRSGSGPVLLSGGALPGEKVLVMVWPTGEVRKVERGTTAGHIIKTQGEITIDADGKAAVLRRAQRRAKLVNVNNRLVPESTPLKTGDYVVLSRDLLEI